MNAHNKRLHRTNFARWVVSMAFGLAALANTASSSGEPFERLRLEVLKVLRTEYPEASLANDRGRYVFGQNLREFVVYRPNKMGEWQKPRTVQAPDRGGILLEFYVDNRPWEGALFIPHFGREDLYMFKETTLVRESSDRQWHVWVRILTPRYEPPSNVETELVALLSGFEQYRGGL